MKKLLYNKNRTKIFNLDHLISIEKIVDNDNVVYGILLKFSSEDYFLVTPGNSSTTVKLIAASIGYFAPDIYKKAYQNICAGNLEENKKLYEFFEHKFSRSSLCGQNS